MLCKQILYLKGNKKSTKTAVKYLHFCRFRQNIKSSCTVKSPVPFLSILSSLPPPVCTLLLLFSVLRAAATKRDPLHSYGDRAGDPPGVWDNTHPAEPPEKYICEMFLKNRHKIFGYSIIPFFFFFNFCFVLKIKPHFFGYIRQHFILACTAEKAWKEDAQNNTQSLLMFMLSV